MSSLFSRFKKARCGYPALKQNKIKTRINNICNRVNQTATIQMQFRSQLTANNIFFSEKRCTRFAYFGLKTQRRRVGPEGVTPSLSAVYSYFSIVGYSDAYLLPMFLLFTVYLLRTAFFCVLGMFILFRVDRSLGGLIYGRLVLRVLVFTSDSFMNVYNGFWVGVILYLSEWK